MFTFNFKVLSIILTKCIGFTLAMWITTAFLGTGLLTPTRVIELPFYQLLFLSMIFSTPSFFVLTPALLLRPKFPTRISKVLYVTSMALLACIPVIAFFFYVAGKYPLDHDLTVALVKPYVVAAIIVVPPTGFFALSSLKQKINCK